ncbi:DEAD/DEAH box helicase [Bradyrhizobium japonicum]|uniref:DEAD/DEAH box helicase n=1 Tax=Bradyrhizobium japonicum TaxID=375 RepID=UPI0009B73E09|nr:DEAD/DEAH box helicase [Bradyrhizobium japonicum]WLB89650.1 DEAD/DEAH box helicase [Bradyrhizobium japonicum USDA 135]
MAQRQSIWNRARNPQSWISASAPTASGKTFLVLQWLIDEMKASGATIAVYLAPTRALASEIEGNLTSLIKRMSIEDIEVTSLPLSAKHLDASKAGKKLIYILTQERLHLLANGFNDGMRIDILVADEAHKVGDHLRGVVLQDAIERASRSNPKIKIVFISPATQNPEALLDDAPATTRKEAVDSDIPTVLQNVVMATQPSRKATEWLFKLRQSKETYLPIGSVTLQARPTSLKKKLALIATSIGSKGGTLELAPQIRTVA